MILNENHEIFEKTGIMISLVPTVIRVKDHFLMEALLLGNIIVYIEEIREA